MRIAVTGATGNIGSALVRRLAREPGVDEVIGIARRAPAWAPPRVRWVPLDLAAPGTSARSIAGAIDGVDALVHAAWAIQPAHDVHRQWLVNVVGSRRVFDAVVEAHVPALVHLSSVGAYSPGPRHRTVDESHPTDGVPTLPYSTQKAHLEALLDGVEARHPWLRVVRIRPALVFQRRAASEVHRLFVGGLLPRRLIPPHLARSLVRHGPLQFQCVHAEDSSACTRRTSPTRCGGRASDR